MPDALYRSYWGGVHATLSARNPEPAMYRVHMVRPASPLLVPAPPSVQTSTEARCLFDGFAELQFTSEQSARRWERHRLVQLIAEDEQNVFSHVSAYWSREGNALVVKDAIPQVVIDGPQGLPTFVILVRRRAGVQAGALRDHLVGELAPAYAAAEAALRVGVYLLDEYVDDWSSPNVTHGEGDDAYHGWLELTIGQLDAVPDVLASAAVRRVLEKSPPVVAAMHPYHEYETYTYRRNGRPTLTGLRGYEIASTAVAAGALNQLTREVTELTTGARRPLASVPDPTG